MKNKSEMKQIKIFWCHPALMDYRKPFFDLVNKKYFLKFYFEQRSKIKSDYDCIYRKKQNRRLIIDDFRVLYRGIKDSDIFISSFLGTYLSVIGMIFAKILGKKVIIWEEIWFFHKKIKFRVKYFIFKFIIKLVDAFFVLGDSQRIALEKLGADRKKIFVSNEYPGYVYGEIPNKKVNLHLSNNKKIILYIGRFVEVKGLEYLVEAFSFLEREDKSVVLLIVGYGPLEDKIKKLVSELKIKSIKFLGKISDIKKKAYLFRKSNLVVVPSITTDVMAEGGPLVVLEALSAGTPVVGTNALGSSSNFIYNGINGFVVPEKNPKALSEKILRVLKWNEKKTEKRVLDYFYKIKGHDHQFKQLGRAINFSLQKS